MTHLLRLLLRASGCHSACWLACRRALTLSRRGVQSGLAGGRRSCGAVSLQVQVDAGGVSTVKVVTNAQNVEDGMKVVFAVSWGCLLHWGVVRHPAGQQASCCTGVWCAALTGSKRAAALGCGAPPGGEASELRAARQADGCCRRSCSWCCAPSRLGVAHLLSMPQRVSAAARGLHHPQRHQD